MKKKAFFVLFVAFIFLLSGCKKETQEKEGEKEKTSMLEVGEVKTNTLTIGKNGEIQSSLAEDFNKEYYKKEELEDYIKEEVAKYTNEHGKDTVTMSSLKMKEGVANMTFHFASMEDYEAFSHVTAKHYSMEEAIEKDVIPEEMSIVDKDGSILKENVEEKSKYKVVVIEEELNLVVSGTIVYYSNGAILNKTTIKSTGEGETIVVYK